MQYLLAVIFRLFHTAYKTMSLNAYIMEVMGVNIYRPNKQTGNLFFLRM